MRYFIFQNLRWLTRRRAYTLSVMATMTLGLALLAIVVSAYSAFMLRPLGVDDAERLLRIRELKPGGGTGIESTLSVSPAAYHLWQQRDLPFTGMALSTGRELSLTGGDQPERLDAGAVSSNIFDVLGVEPLLGRAFAEGEDTAGQDGLVLLSHAFWQRRFQADRGVVGQTIELDGVPRTVIGVMPEGFSYPYDAQVWVPEVLGDTINEPGHWTYNVIARLEPGISIGQARERMSQVAARATAERPQISHAPGVHLREFRTEILGGLDQVLLVLLAASAFVVLVATFNASNITLARAANERRDDAVRLAMGARRGVLYRMALTRAAVLAGCSAAVALYLARFAALPFAGLRGLSALDQFPTVVRVDAATVLAVAITALISAAVIAAGPIWLQRRHNVREALGGSGKGVDTSERSPLMSGLTAVQIAMSLVLMVGAILVGGAYSQLMNRDRGFDPGNLLVANVSFPAERYPDAGTKERFLETALSEIEAIPGVEQASSATTTPALAGTWGAIFNVEGRPPPEPRGYYITSHRFISDDYFETMDIPLIEGRTLDGRDHREGVHHAVISREFAERFWPGESAVGKRVRRGDRDSDRPWMTVVGVVEDVVEAGELDLWDKSLQWYLPTSLGTDYDFSETFLLIRTGGAVAGINQAIREAVWSADPLMGVEEIAPIQQLMGETFERERYSAMLFAIFGAVSLVIATVGLYGFLAFRAATRYPEFGIRLALGARPGQLRLRVLAESTRLFVAGSILAVPMCFFLVRGVKASLYGVESSGLPEFLAMIALLMTTCLLASLIPASRAAAVEPMKVLRTE